MLVVVLGLALSSVVGPCATVDDCSLNGRCESGVCQCFAPWSTQLGDLMGCGRLDTLPGPQTGIYGQTPHIASWGGSVILDKTDKLYHLFVSEMTEGCGLSEWPSNMEVAHATSKTVNGPYTKVDTALPAQATNPQAILDKDGNWWLFHIGDATTDGRTPTNCTAHPPHPPAPPAPPAPIPPGPPCADYGVVPGYTCHQGTCVGTSGTNCMVGMSEPTLPPPCGAGSNASKATCALEASKLCSKTPGCLAFGMDQLQWAPNKAKLFPNTHLLQNLGWDTWVKDMWVKDTLGNVGGSTLEPTLALTPTPVTMLAPASAPAVTDPPPSRGACTSQQLVRTVLGFPSQASQAATTQPQA
jgi:hypothetical protein